MSILLWVVVVQHPEFNMAINEWKACLNSFLFHYHYSAGIRCIHLLVPPYIPLLLILYKHNCNSHLWSLSQSSYPDGVNFAIIVCLWQIHVQTYLLREIICSLKWIKCFCCESSCGLLLLFQHIIMVRFATCKVLKMCNKACLVTIVVAITVVPPFFNLCSSFEK